MFLGTDYYISTSRIDDESKAITTLKDAGTVLLYIHGKGNYCGILGSGVSGFGSTVASTEYTITNKKLITELPIDSIANQFYCGGKSKGIGESKALTPAITSINYIKDNARVPLSELKDSTGHALYDISYENNEEIGTATVIVRATKYNDQFCDEGEKRVTFRIVANSMNNVNLYKYDPTDSKFKLHTKYPDVEYTGYCVDTALNIEGWYLDNLSVYNTIGSEAIALVSGSPSNTATNIDYNKEWINATNVGVASIRIVGRNAYEGLYKDFRFRIVPCDISKPENASKIELKGVESNPDVYFKSADKSISVNYSAGKVKPEPILKFNYNSVPLVKGKDYILSYVNFVNAAKADAKDAFGRDIAPKIVVTFMGNLKGKMEIPYTINPENIDGAVVTWPATAVKYTGWDIKLNPTVTLNGSRLILDKDYIITQDISSYEAAMKYKISSVKELGEYKLYIYGIGNYEEGINKPVYYYVVDKSKKLITELPVDSIVNQGYLGGGNVTPHIFGDVKSIGKALDFDSTTGFSITYENNTEIGTATAIIKAKAGNPNYWNVGEKRVNFRIVENNLIYSNLMVAIPTQTYSQGESRPEFNLCVKMGSRTVMLTKNTDYTVAYKNNAAAGTATVTVTGRGKCTGTKSFTFRIVPLAVGEDDVTAGNFTINNKDGYYNGGMVTPHPTISYKGVLLTENKDYSILYRNNINVAAADAKDARGNSIAPTMTIVFKGNYTGKIEVNYAIKKKAVTADEVTISANDGVLYNSIINNWKQIPNSIVLKENNTRLVNHKDCEIVYMIVNAAGNQVYYTNDVKDETIKSKYSGKMKCTDSDIKEIIGFKKSRVVTMYVEFIGGYANGSDAITYEYTASTLDISGCTATIEDVTYTGAAITFKPEDVLVKDRSGNVVSKDYYTIVEDSYKNNVNAGNASVTIKGQNGYIGKKVILFKIKQQGMTWWEKLWANL